MSDANAKPGRFVKGVSGNPNGRPKGSKNRLTELRTELELAVIQHVKPKDIKSILDKLVMQALNGDVKAAKLILDKFVANASSPDEEQNNTPRIAVIIQNATDFAKAQQPSAVDGEFTEVKEKTECLPAEASQSSTQTVEPQTEVGATVSETRE